MVVPRIGQELMISCLDGNPDQLIATGRTFSQANQPPYEQPKYAGACGGRNRANCTAHHTDKRTSPHNSRI